MGSNVSAVVGGMYSNRVAQTIVQQLESSSVPPEERALLEGVLEQMRPHVSREVFTQYYRKRTIEMRQPLGERYAMPSHFSGYSLYGRDAATIAERVAAFARQLGAEWTELCELNELEVVQRYGTRRAGSLLAQLGILRQIATLAQETSRG